MATLARRFGVRHPLLYGGALIFAVIVGAALAYAQRFLGDNGPYIIIGAFLVLVIIVAILLEWRLGVLLLPAILPFENFVNLGNLASGTKAVALLTFLSFALGALREQKLFGRLLRLWKQPLTWATFLFALWALASISWASNPEAAMTRSITFLGLFGLMVVIGMLEERWLRLLWAAVTLSTALSVPAAYLLPQSGKMGEQGRFGTAGADPNDYAGFAVIVFFAAYFGLKRYKRMIYVLAPILLFGIFATQSRTGLVALVAAPVLAAPLVPRLAARLGGRTLLMYGLGAAALAGIILAIPSVGESLSGRYETLSQYEDESTWSGRWGIWQAAFRIIASHPFFGVGAGNFPYAALDLSSWVMKHSAEEGEVSGVAHNMFLSVASELGFVGLIMFSAVIFFAFRMVVPICQETALGTGMLVCLIAFTIAGMTLTWEYQENGYILFGSVLALHLQRSVRQVALPGRQENSRW